MLFDDAVAALLLLRLSTTVKSLWGLPGRTSLWSSTPGHPICGCHQRTASVMPVVRQQHTALHNTCNHYPPECLGQAVMTVWFGVF